MQQSSGACTPVAGTPCSFSSEGTSNPRQTPPFSVEVVPHNIRDMQYAVRGRVLDRAFELEKDLKAEKITEFNQLLRCHIGNPHAVGAPALTYIREVLSLVTCPDLFDPRAEAALLQVYKSDSLERARAYRKLMGEPGAYTHSQGAICFREEIADFFERRDGVRPDPETIYLTNGASDAISTVLSVMVGGPDDCVLLPMPQYPLYSATMTKLNGHVEFYELDEDNDWKCTIDAIDKAWRKAYSLGKDVKAIAIIDPGNPAPTVLNEDDVAAILKYASDKNMAVIADEVYQENLYNFNVNCSVVEAQATDARPELSTCESQALPAPEGTFCPFRRVLFKYGYNTQLVSLHSSSKGFYGECGFRGGLMQLDNMDKESIALMYKVRSVELCSNTIGQICMTLVCNPPKPGSPSYDGFLAEKTSILNDLAEKARLTTEFLNSLEGVTCRPIRGALYAFPRIRFSEKAKKLAAESNMSPDLKYCLDLVNETGIVTVPGDAFGQRRGTNHLRMTILPRLADLKSAFARYRKFHENFMSTTADDSMKCESSECSAVGEQPQSVVCEH